MNLPTDRRPRPGQRMTRYGWHLAVALCLLLVGIVLGAAVAANPDPAPAPTRGVPALTQPGPPVQHGYLRNTHP